MAILAGGWLVLTDRHRARRGLLLKPFNFPMQFGCRRISADANRQCQLLRQFILRNVQSTIQIMDDLRQSHLIQIEHTRRVRVLAQLRRVAGNQQDIP